MPRGTRLDAPGALDNEIIRSIEQREIVIDADACLDFLSWIGDALSLAVETG